MRRPNLAGRHPRMPDLRLLALAALAGSLVLGGCDSTRDALGLNKKSPDEFVVVTKAPLVLPPEFGLRPPEPGAARPQEVSARDRAAAALVGNNQGRAPAQQRSAGEQALLQQAHASNVDPDIRRKVNDEFTQLAERDRRLVDRLMFWQTEDPGLAVDPAKEAQRLRENAATGKPVTAGSVPTLKRRERGPLEGLF
ncbi:MAG: DUF3035 domain-containing protein [Ferrovibrio sp.]